MQAFLDQFNLSPVARVDMENFIYTQADNMLPGYAGGTWESVQVGNVWVLALPVEGERVTLNNYAFGGSVTTDPLTAAACFSAIVANWYSGLRYEQGRLSGAALSSFAKFADAIADAVYAKDSGVNKQDYFSFTD